MKIKFTVTSDLHKFTVISLNSYHGITTPEGKDQNLEGLFNIPWFFGELSRENATEILNKAVKNDGESWHKKDALFRDRLR